MILAACIALSMGGAAEAIDINVIKVTNKMMYAHMNASKQQAFNRVAGYTTLFKVSDFPRALQKLVPVSGVAVFYFKKNGTVLAWSGKSQKVEAGKWYLTRNWNDICVSFPQGKGKSVCTNFMVSTKTVKETTLGNPFNLKAGEPVPYKLGRFGVTLKKIARKIQ